MNEFLASLKADLTDRRLVPIVAVACALLVAAIAYALLGGGSSSAPPTVPPVQSVAPTTGIAVTSVTTTKAVAETTDGTADQTKGLARNPFAPLPGSGATTTAATVSASTSSPSPLPTSPSTSTSSSGESTSSGSGGSASTESSGSSNSGSQSKPKAKTVYDVTVKFGTLPLGITPETANLHEYKSLKLQEPLPSAETHLVVFRGVTAKGKSATFTLVSEAIPTGAGACLPSPVQCEAVDLKPGETEQFAVQENGLPVTYELRVLSIEAGKAKTASAKASAASRRPDREEWGVSRVGQELLRKAGLVAMPFLRYSSQPGVLVFSKPKPKQTHAQGPQG